MNDIKKTSYEAFFLVSANEAVAAKSVKKIQEIFEEYQVEITREEALGIKTLAYPVEKNSTGKYYLYYIQLEPSKMDALRKELRLQEDILRFMFIALDKKATKFLDEKHIADIEKKKVAEAASAASVPETAPAAEETL